MTTWGRTLSLSATKALALKPIDVRFLVKNCPTGCLLTYFLRLDTWPNHCLNPACYIKKAHFKLVTEGGEQNGKVMERGGGTRLQVEHGRGWHVMRAGMSPSCVV